MKKLLFIVTVIACNSVLAQKIYVGPEAGINIINVQKEEIGRDFQLGIHAGASFEYNLNDWFALNSGLYFTQTKQGGQDFDTTPFEIVGFDLGALGLSGIDMNTYSSTEYRQTQNYFQIPMMGTFKWKNIRLSLGGYGGFMLSANRKESFVSDTPFLNTIDLSSLGIPEFLLMFLPESHEESFSESSDKDDLRAFDYGLKGSLGYQSDNFGINVAYVFGLPDYRTEYEDRKRHRYIQISARYMFGFGKSSGESKI